jgi:hypothetical protein
VRALSHAGLTSLQLIYQDMTWLVAERHSHSRELSTAC